MGDQTKHIGVFRPLNGPPTCYGNTVNEASPANRKRILFLCSQNKLRSPTAEAVLASHPSVEVDSAGLNSDAVVPLAPEQIEWADLILVMEKAHRNRLNRKFGQFMQGKRVAVLNIPDEFEFMDSELVSLLKTRCAPYIPSIPKV